MAAVASLRCNKKLKEFYDRLLANHKPAKVALVAVMRKLLGFIHAVVKNNSFWNNNYGDKPFIIFGYSISALITFEFVRGIMNASLG